MLANMQDPSEPAPATDLPFENEVAAAEVASPPPPKKGLTLLAWLIIIGVVSLMVGRSLMKGGPAEAAQQARLQEIMFEMQARYAIGASHFVPDKSASLYQEISTLDGGNWDQRLRFVVVAGELAGPRTGLTKAQLVQEQMQADDQAEFVVPTAKQKKVATILIDLYENYASGDYELGSLSQENKDFLRSELGWFGELALQPRRLNNLPPGLAGAGGAAAVLALEPVDVEPANRELVMEPAVTTFGTVLGAVGSACFVSCGGFVGLAIFLAMLTGRKLNGGLVLGAPHGGVYAETFALFLLSFLGLGLLLQRLPREVPVLLKAGLVPLGSLLVLFWPVARGISWTRVRQDIGWTMGKSPAVEPFMGIACYVMALPIVLVGLVLSLVLMAVRNQVAGFNFGLLAQNQPIHPIVEFIVHGNAADRALVFFEACILAPIIEETMFRGVLYRHLRELSHRWNWLTSVALSGTIVSFIFAVIHPQGLVAVPVLMALAYGFTIAREWRDSLIASMVGHAINNAMVVFFVILVMGG